jgi:hypothetical protein
VDSIDSRRAAVHGDCPGAVPPRPDPPRDGRKTPFVQTTVDQLAAPEPGRGESPDGLHLTPLEKLVLIALGRPGWCFRGGVCKATDLEIADAIGLRGTTAAKRRRVQIALHGRRYAGRNPETGKRDGDAVPRPGPCDPSRGFIEVRRGPTGGRELVLTARWLEWAQVRVYQGGGEAPPAAAGKKELVDEVVAGGSEADTAGPAVTPATLPMGTADPAACADPSVAAGTTTGVGGGPTPEVLKAVLGRYAGRCRADQAVQILWVLRNRSNVFWVEDGMVRHKPSPGCTGPVSDDEQEVLKGLEPELVTILKAEAQKSAKGAKPGAPQGPGKTAPPVSNPVEIRKMITRLRACPAADDSDCHALARRLVTDPNFSHGDKDPALSEKTYLGLARDTKRGELAENILLGAFEEACLPRKRNRAAAFIAAVKRLKGAAYGRVGGRT